MTNPKKNRKTFNIILAVILAVGVWLYVINVENPTSTATIRDIPVTVVGEDTLAERGLMLTAQSQDRISLKLSCRKKTLMKLSAKNITLELDLSSVTTAGTHTLSCQYTFPNSIGSDSISISNWEDLRVTVTVEKQSTKEIPVRGEFIGTEAEDCLAGMVTTDPATIKLTGPADTLDGISYALASVGGKAISDTLVESSSVVFMGHEGTPADRRNITASAETVEVTVPVRQVVSVPLTVELMDGGGVSKDTVKVDISPKTVTVVAKKEGEPLPESISLGQIDLSAVMADASYAIPVHLPKEVTAWGKQVRYASVSLHLEKEVSRQILVKDITYENVPQGYKTEPMTEGVYVWVRGKSDLVEDLDPSQIHVTVDLSDASVQSKLQRVPAKVSLAETKELSILGTHYSIALRLRR